MKNLQHIGQKQTLAGVPLIALYAGHCKGKTHPLDPQYYSEEPAPHRAVHQSPIMNEYRVVADSAYA